MADFTGRFIWYELLTHDVDAAIRFYTNVVGWTTQLMPVGGEPYHLWMQGDRMIGGVMKMPGDAQAPPSWMGYIATPDIAKTVARAAELGATIYVPPTGIPGVGTFSVIADPQGAMFSAFQAVEVPAWRDNPPGTGDIAWNELATSDRNAARNFYADVFGWTMGQAHDMGPAGIYQLFSAGGRELGGIYLKPAEMPGPPHWMYYIVVADINAAAERVKANGGQVILGPHEVPDGDLILMCMDPQGATFALHWKKV
jgi:uncharacterized protein